MERNFCYLCGTRLEQKEEFVWYCPQCQMSHYANPKPCVDIALFDENNHVLMATRGIEPDKGKIDLPGGFIDINETVEEAFYREMKEEIGLEKVDVSEPVYVGSRTHDYPFGKEVYKNIVLVFCAQLLAPKSKIRADDDVAATSFHAVESLKVPQVASQEHIKLIRQAFEKYTGTPQ